MTSTHIDHPEDCILTGNLSVIDALYDKGFISMKMDGMSLVWGTNPANGKFFVCTKSAFNKKKIRLCYTTEDILTHFGHQIEVVDILSNCLKYLPRTDNIYWGDWLGFGHTDVLTQNTLTYAFPEAIEQRLVIAPHTVVNVYAEMCDSVCEPLTDTLEDTDTVKWVQPAVDRIYGGYTAPKINTDNIKFLTDKEAYQAKIGINALIKSGQYVDDATLTDILGCPQLANLYQLVIDIKYDLMDSLIINDAPKAYLPNGKETEGEGYVFHSETYGSFKLVNRTEFAYANFHNGFGS
jgi:hypothetical protein